MTSSVAGPEDPEPKPQVDAPVFQQPNPGEERAKWVQEQGKKRDEPPDPDRFEPV